RWFFCFPANKRSWIQRLDKHARRNYFGIVRWQRRVLLRFYPMYSYFVSIALRVGVFGD
ncbi:hypothetical protein CONLIGDRAFT_627665, partial [Coniochaeta ligniaria NRRL 30616]